MGKKLLKHMLIIGGILVVVGILDWFIFTLTGKPVICLYNSGGEYRAYYGIWYIVEKFYPFIQPGEPGVIVKASFMPAGGLILFVLLTAISMIPIHRKKK